MFLGYLSRLLLAWRYFSLPRTSLDASKRRVFSQPIHKFPGSMRPGPVVYKALLFAKVSP